MRFVLCILLVALPSFAFAAKGTMSLSQAQAAAQKGDADAAAAIATTTDHQTCLDGCAKRGHNKGQCTNACRPGAPRRLIAQRSRRVKAGLCIGV